MTRLPSVFRDYVPQKPYQIDVIENSQELVKKHDDYRLIQVK